MSDSTASTVPTPAAPAPAQRLVQTAARTLGRHGLTHAYGHCSMRLDADHFLVCASKPPGLVSGADAGHVLRIDADLPAGVLGEVRLHRDIYRRRPEVGGVVRSMPPALMTLSAMRRTPRVLHGLGAYFAAGVPLWDDPTLIRTDALAAAVIDQLGDRSAVVMRGNGTVVAAESLPDAVVLTWFLEDAARIDLACLQAHQQPVEFTADESARRATRAGFIFERMWDHLTTEPPTG